MPKRDEAFNTIKDLIIVRQDKPVTNNVSNNDSKASKPQELREFKKLLDEGIITEEEFNQEKKKILEK